MTRARLILCLLVAMVASTAAAAITIAPGEHAAKPGDVIVVAFTQTGGGTVEVQPSGAFVFLGTTKPDPGTGEAIATFLVTQDAHAGEYSLTFTQSDANGVTSRASAHLQVLPSVGARVTVSGPDTITATSSATFVANIVNLGNITDTYRFTVSSNDAVTLSSGSVRLDPGKAATITLDISPLGFGERLGTLNVHSAANPSYETSALIQYTSLALGSSDPNAPFLAYSLPLGATYGSQGLTYHAGGSVSGDLSSLANTNNAFAVSPTATSAFLGLYGDTWGTTYSYSSTLGHHLVVRDHGVDVQGTLSPEGRVTTGIGYGRNGWGVSYSHTWGPLASDRLLASHTFAVAKTTTLMLAAGAAGEVRSDGHYYASPAGHVTATYSGDGAIVSLSADVTPFLDVPWSALATAYSRDTQPWGVSGSVHVDPTSFDTNIQFTETPRADLEAMQSLSYSYPSSFGGLFSVSYTSPSNGPDVFGVGNLTLTDGSLDVQGLITANITRLPWLASVSAQFAPGISVAFGETYLATDYSISGSVAVPLDGTLGATLGLRGSYVVDGASLGAGLGFDTGTGAYSVSGALGIPFFPGVNVQGQLGYGSATGVSWQVGVTATLQGAFAVPSAVVQAFGGVDAGTVTGVVTKASSKGVAPAEGIAVAALGANRVSTTDTHGRYKLTLPPGTYTLAFPGLSAQLVPPDRPTVTVRREATVRKDLQLQVSYAITGQVFLDPTGNGTPGAASVGLAGVSVNLDRNREVVATVQSGANGAFAFRELQPGSYRVELVDASLPTGYTSTTPPRTVEVSDTRLPFVSLGATPPKATVKNTLGAGSIALSTQVLPNHAPPQAVVTVRVRASAATSVVVEASDGSETKLRAARDGTFEGQVEIPASASAVELFKVTAANATSSSTQTAMVLVNDEPLATLTLDPGSPEVGAEVTAQAHVLVRADRAWLKLGDATIELTSAGDQRFTGSFAAPAKAGDYPITLFVDGKARAERTLSVSPSPGGG